MSKLAVKYDNKMNTIPLRKFTVSELNIFYTICANIKEKGTNKVVYDFDKFRELANYQFTGNARFIEDLESTYDKLLDLKIKLENDKKLIMFNLFNYFEVDKENQTVEIAVNEHFEFILNDLGIEGRGKFTTFPLIEYTDINSTYTKAIYTHLKQWRRRGKWEVSIDDFKELLSIPNSYKMSDIDKQILTPAIRDLKALFQGLKVFKLDKNNRLSGKGRPVRKIRFTFKQQDDNRATISKDKRIYGKHDNVYLTDKEMNTIVYEWRVKYIIDEISEWKLKNPSDFENRDFALIEKFKLNKEKANFDKGNPFPGKSLDEIYGQYQEEERIDINGNLFNQLLMDIED